MTQDAIVQEIAAAPPDVLLVGHSGSSTAHPTIVELCAHIKRALPKLTRKKRRPAPASLHLEDHSDKIFSMFTGPEETVTLRCRPHLMNVLVDRFGTDLNIIRRDEKSLDVTVTVNLSPTFYGWLFQFAGEMTVIAPGPVCDKYAERLQTAIDDALGN